MLGFSSATFIPRPRPPQDSTAEPRKPRLRKDVTSRRFLVCHACVCTHTLTHMCFLCTRLSLPVRPYLCCDVRVRVLLACMRGSARARACECLYCNACACLLCKTYVARFCCESAARPPPCAHAPFHAIGAIEAEQTRFLHVLVS
jgi:hypothetical protein